HGVELLDVYLGPSGVLTGSARLAQEAKDQAEEAPPTQRDVQRQQTEAQAKRKALDAQFDFSEIVGEHPDLLKVLSTVGRVAGTRAPVLILGESGTGKELIADAIHRNSPRAGKAAVKINMGAITSTLFESEMFGHVRGSFTDAKVDRKGHVASAHGSTLFLDEIGELNRADQVKLLRVLQEKEFERLGSNKVQKCDVRLIAATNRKLDEEIEKGKFRSDLYYRLNVLPIYIPPLRDRQEDIPLLVQVFIEQFNRKSGKNIQSISKATLDKLMNYHWPGNVRELENIIERAHVLSTGSKLDIGNWFKPASDIQSSQDELLSMDDNEKAHILRVIKLTRWKIRGENGAAEILKINPSTLESRMKKLGIERPV
ncbi:MAG: sigma 54-interacting transcriptional regulator, partial [Bacteroidales bacterium]|nr:sigma 54-interacting transcriptional regulator [Bacteroidales bacterium]